MGPTWFLILFLEILLMNQARWLLRDKKPIIFFLERNLSYGQVDSRIPQGNRPVERLKDLKKKLLFYLMPNNLWLGLFSLAKLTWLPSYLLSQRHSSLQRMKKEIVSCNQISCLLNKSGRDGLWENKAADINISLFYLDLFHSSVVIWWSLSCQPIIFSYWPNGGVLGERWHPLTFLQLFPWLSPPDTHTHILQ